MYVWWSAGLVSGQLGEGGVHLVGQTLVSVFVDAQLIYTQKRVSDYKK